MNHILKTWPEYFQAVKGGIKRFEFRKDDRNYQEGDTLELHEYDHSTDSYSGDSVRVEVLYILPVVLPSREQYACMSISEPKPVRPAEPYRNPTTCLNGVRFGDRDCPGCEFEPRCTYEGKGDYKRAK